MSVTSSSSILKGLTTLQRSFNAAAIYSSAFSKAGNSKAAKPPRRNYANRGVTERIKRAEKAMRNRELSTARRQLPRRGYKRIGLSREIEAEARTLRIPASFLRERWATTDVTRGVTERLKELAATAGIGNLIKKPCRYASPQSVFLLHMFPILRQNKAIPMGKHLEVALGMYHALSQEENDDLLREAKERNMSRCVVPPGMLAFGDQRGIPRDVLIEKWHAPEFEHMLPEVRIRRIARWHGLFFARRGLSEHEKIVYNRSLELNIPYELAKSNWYLKR
eukprot:GILI01016459.1.p1 GENE.GILI01016459.1~~GILI01016459.1.p1  ORF type:complete len:279 (-),score=4.14 GILI01016459.1:295-1131(-)